MNTAVADKTLQHSLRESVTLSAQPGRGIYRAVLLREGPGNPRDRHWYTPEGIEQAVRDRIFEGLPCYADHPDRIEEEARPERSVKDMVGWWEHVTNERGQDGKMALTADLVTIPGPSTQWVRDLFNAALLKRERTPGATELVGLSINATGITRPMDVDGEEWHAVEQFVEAKSVDAVTQAGAGGRIVALKEAMVKRAREGRMSALQVKKAVAELQTRQDADLQPVIDELEKVYLDLTHEPQGTRKKEGRLGSMATQPSREEVAQGLEARVRAVEEHIFGKRTVTPDPKSDAAASRTGLTEADDDDDMPFTKYAGADEEPDEEKPDAAKGLDGDEEPKDDDEPEDDEDDDDEDEEIKAAFEAINAGAMLLRRRLRGSRKKEREREMYMSEEKQSEGGEEERESQESEGSEASASKATEAHEAQEGGEGQTMSELTPAILDKGKAKGDTREAGATKPPLRVPAGLREATAKRILEETAKADPTKEALAKENARLKAELAARDEAAEAVSILKEVGVPEGSHRYLFDQMVGRTKDEKKELAEAYLDSLRSARELLEDPGTPPTVPSGDKQGADVIAISDGVEGVPVVRGVN